MRRALLEHLLKRIRDDLSRLLYSHFLSVVVDIEQGIEMPLLALQLCLLLAIVDDYGLAHSDLLLLSLYDHLLVHTLRPAPSYLPDDDHDNFNKQEEHVDEDVESDACD